MRPALIATAVVLAAVAAAALGLYLWAMAPQPGYQGERTLAGLDAAVEVRYGPHAVPSIRAEGVGDLVFAQGFVVARERFWQMDLLRRLAGGRLAEVFGAEALPADRFYRTLGLSAGAERTLAALEPRWRRLLARYADGVNAYLAQAQRRPPLEYRIAGFAPQPWQPSDSLLAVAYMAWLNAANLREELVFLRLAGRLGTPRALELFPTNPGEPAPADARALPDYRLAGADKAARAAPSGGQARVGGGARAAAAGGTAASNAWALEGARSTGDGALLANDPHLAPSLPATWYELELQAPGYHAAGVTVPGIPLVLIGHNADLAWGLTAAVADTQDLFLERVSADGDGVLRAGGRIEPIRSRREAIAVAGRDAPVWLEVESTRHGVLIDHLLRGPGGNPAGLTAVERPERLALRHTLGEPDRAIPALWRLNTAASLAEARAAMADVRHAAVNLVVAHRNGRIGWQVSGALPRRGRGTGTFPVPGWAPDYGWRGIRDFARNPGVTDPAGGRLISANDAMPYDPSAPAIGHCWLPPFRAERIGELLDAAERPDAAAMRRMQRDRNSLEARLILDALGRHRAGLRAADPQAARIAREGLLGWDGTLAGDSRAAALFTLLRAALYEALYRDELGPDLDALMGLDNVTYGPLAEALRSDRSSFWDDVGTPGVVEGPVEVWARALRSAEARLAASLPRPRAQRLDRLRRLTFPHAFDDQPYLGPLFSIGPLGRGGDAATIDVAGGVPTRPRAITNIPSLRVVFTPGDWSGTQGSLPLGQSGHRLSRHRSDQLDDWLAGETHAWPWGGPEPGSEIGELRLQPR